MMSNRLQRSEVSSSYLNHKTQVRSFYFYFDSLLHHYHTAFTYKIITFCVAKKEANRTVPKTRRHHPFPLRFSQPTSPSTLQRPSLLLSSRHRTTVNVCFSTHDTCRIHHLLELLFSSLYNEITDF